MRRSGLILIILGILLALASGLGVMSVLNNQQQQQVVATPTPIPTVKVVVASQTIPARSVLQVNMLALKDWPLDLLPAGTVTNTQALVGQVTQGLIVAGEPVLLSKVGNEPNVVGLAPSLPPGLVAMDLSFSAVNAVGGAIQQGDTVDVLVSMEYTLYNETGDESKPLNVTFYTVQDVMVLAVSGGTETSAATPPGAAAAAQSLGSSTVMLTVLVTPQDALLLKHAREQGTIDVVLRSPQYHDEVITDPVYLDYIMRRFDLPKPVLIQKQSTAAGASQ